MHDFPSFLNLSKDSSLLSHDENSGPTKSCQKIMMGSNMIIIINLKADDTCRPNVLIYDIAWYDITQHTFNTTIILI